MYNNHNKDVWYLLKRGMLALYTLYTISMIYPLFQSSFKITINIQVQLTQKKTYIYIAACVHTCDKNGIVSECAPKTKGRQGRKR